MTQLTSDAIIKDLKEVIKKHEEMPSCEFNSSVTERFISTEIERWIPICEEYKTSGSMYVCKEKGGSLLGWQKPVSVLAWVKVKIDPIKPMGITILEYSKLS